MKRLLFVAIAACSLIVSVGCNKDKDQNEPVIATTPDSDCLHSDACYYAQHGSSYYQYGPYDYFRPYQYYTSAGNTSFWNNGFSGCSAGFYPVYEPTWYGLGCVNSSYVGWNYSWAMWGWNYSANYWYSANTPFYNSYPGQDYTYLGCRLDVANSCGAWGACYPVGNGYDNFYVGICR